LIYRRSMRWRQCAERNRLQKTGSIRRRLEVECSLDHRAELREPMRAGIRRSGLRRMPCTLAFARRAQRRLARQWFGFAAATILLCFGCRQNEAEIRPPADARQLPTPTMDSDERYETSISVDGPISSDVR
jgi:hypothetical protein